MPQSSSGPSHASRSSTRCENIHRLDAAIFHGLVTPNSGGRAPARLRGSLACRCAPGRGRHDHPRSGRTSLPLRGRSTCRRSDAALSMRSSDTTRVVVVANQELSTVRRAGRMVASLQAAARQGSRSVVINRFDQQVGHRHKDVEHVVEVPRSGTRCRATTGSPCAPRTTDDRWRSTTTTGSQRHFAISLVTWPAFAQPRRPAPPTQPVRPLERPALLTEAMSDDALPSATRSRSR